jgi:hypothetical protein
VRVLLLTRGARTVTGSRDEGAVAVLAALLMTLILVLAAFAVDIANAYANARQLSVAADAAALSAAAEVGKAYPAGQPCSAATLASIDATGIARAEADRVNTKNSKRGTPEPVGSVTVTCAASFNAIDVRITNDRAVKTALAGIIGIDELTPNSYAVARFQRMPTGGGLRPWAICDDVVRAAEANRNRTYWTGLDNQGLGVCNTQASGNWGGVDFDGGNNAAGDLADWTMNGYPGPVDIPDPLLPADPGVSNSSALTAAFTAIVGQVVLLPSVTGFNPGGGNNASFDAVGVATVEICGIYYGNNVYNTGSSCWRDPMPQTTSTPTVTLVTGVSMANNSSVVTTTVDDSFEQGMVGGTITVPNAGNNAGTSPLTGEIVSVSANGRTATLRNGDRARNPVTNVTATVSWTKVEQVPGSLGVPIQNNGRPIDHIQFRYVDYVTSFTGGTTSPPCPLTRVDCAGVTQLWR